MRKDKYYIADGKYCSIILMMRRSWWADAHGYPTLNKYRIDPRYAPRQFRDEYQAQVSAWWDALDPGARKFLGPDYKRMAARQ